MHLDIGTKTIGPDRPTYIIAEVGSNFDGSLERAKSLATLAKECGADAYKIQNFLAPQIVSNIGFQNLQVAFQANWDKPVVDVYKAAEFPRAWVKEVADHCREIGIDFFSSPYDLAAVDLLEEINVAAHKIGSGEIDNLPFLRYCAKSGKPMLLGCGAATMEEIDAAVRAIRSVHNQKIVLLQCVTNYPSPVADANIRSMPKMRRKFETLVGYSDHTIGSVGGGDDPLGGITVPLAAVSLGACVIEKHFTDDRTRKGPDHPFAMEANAFAVMVRAIRALERSLGDGKKRVMPSEEQTVIIQRRGTYALRDLTAGDSLSSDQVEYLRPAVGLRPRECELAFGRTLARNIPAGDPIREEDLAPRS